MFMFLNQFLAVRSQCSFGSPANYEITPTNDRYPGRWRTLYWVGRPLVPKVLEFVLKKVPPACLGSMAAAE